MAATQPLGEPQALLFLCFLYSKRSAEKSWSELVLRKRGAESSSVFGHCSLKVVALPLYLILHHTFLWADHSVTDAWEDVPPISFA